MAKATYEIGDLVVYKGALKGSVKRNIPILRLAKVHFGFGMKMWIPYKQLKRLRS